MAASSLSAGSATPSVIDGWLAPLADDPSGSPCGEDLEYDPAFLELALAAAGKPETQFSAAEPPAWAEVASQSEALLGRTRDLRVGLAWARATINLRGVAGVADGLRLLGGWLDSFWEPVHPALDPDDGDAFARISVLGSLTDAAGLLGDVRQALLSTDRRLGGLRVRDVEVALDRLAPRADETPRSLRQIEGVLSDFEDLADQLRAAAAAALSATLALQRLMNDRFGIDRAVDLKPLRSMLEAVRDVVPPAAADDGAAGDADAAADDADAAAAEDGDDAAGQPANRGAAPRGEPAGRRRGRSGDAIESREDAVKAINAICAYLERSEPTNPAQLLLRRAERLIGKNFLQLIKDLAPEAVTEVARIMGVDPDSLNSGDDQ